MFSLQVKLRFLLYTCLDGNDGNGVDAGDDDDGDAGGDGGKYIFVHVSFLRPL